MKTFRFKPLIYTALLSIFFLTTQLTSNAQIGPVDPGCDPLGDPTAPPCPIDGGLSLLIAAGIGLGAKKAYQAKKNSRTVNL